MKAALLEKRQQEMKARWAPAIHRAFAEIPPPKINRAGGAGRRRLKPLTLDSLALAARIAANEMEKVSKNPAFISSCRFLVVLIEAAAEIDKNLKEGK